MSTYPHVEKFDGSAETIRFIRNVLRARDVVAFAPLDDNALILSATVEPSLLNLLLMKPADHDFASRIAHLLAGYGARPGCPWRDIAWRINL